MKNLRLIFRVLLGWLLILSIILPSIPLGLPSFMQDWRVPVDMLRLLQPSPAKAAAGDNVTQVLVNGSATPVQNATRYWSISGVIGNVVAEASTQIPWPHAGNITGIAMEVAKAVDADQQVTLTLRKNGADTAVTTNVSGDTQTTNNNTSAMVAVAAGDLLDMKVVSTVTANVSLTMFTFQFISLASQGSVITGTTYGNLSTTANQSLCISGSRAPVAQASESAVQSVIPTAGTIKNFFVRVTAAPGAGASRIFYLRTGLSTNTTLTATIETNNTSANDTANSFAVAAGTLVTINTDITGTPAAAAGLWSMTFVPDTEGESIILGGSVDDPHTGVTEYNYINGNSVTAWTTTETNVLQLAQATVLRNFYLVGTTSPGGTDSYALTVRLDGVSTALSVNVTGAATSGNDTSNNVTITSGYPDLDMMLVPASAPTAVRWSWGIVAYNAPSAGATNGTTVGSLTLSSTYESISVSANFSGDDNANNSANLSYKLTSGSTWIRAMDMTVDRRTIVGDGLSQNETYLLSWRASVIGLTKNTSYDISVNFTDADGVTGANLTGTISTRSDTFPSSGNTYYVNTTGSDATGDGSAGNPWATVAYAANQTAAGDTVHVAPGTYSPANGIQVSANGTASNYIYFIADGAVTINVTATAKMGQLGYFAAGFWIWGSYIRVSGFTIVGGDVGIFVGPWYIATTAQQPHDVIIEHNTIRDGKTLLSAEAPYRGIQVGTQASTWSGTSNNTIQYNDIYVVEPGALSSTNTSGPGIRFVQANGGHVVRYNNIYFSGTAPTGVHGSDGINNTPNTEFDYTIRDSDIYGNYIEGATDDGISLDGNASNLRVWSNNITGTMAGVSVAAVIQGPAYIFRNIFYAPNKQWSTSNYTDFLKGGEDSTGAVYVYHNTIVYSTLGADTKANYGLTTNEGGGANSQNIFFKNNIMETDGPVYADDAGQPTSDYNLLYNAFTSTFKTYWAKWNATEIGANTTTNALNLAAYTSNTTALGSAQDVNSIAGQATFTDRAGNNYHLSSGSLGVDNGLIIFGFNDSNSAWAYTGANPDMGAYESGSVSWTHSIMGTGYASINKIMGVLLSTIAKVMGVT